jgi:hypothetical protein
MRPSLILSLIPRRIAGIICEAMAAAILQARVAEIRPPKSMSDGLTLTYLVILVIKVDINET